MTEQTSPPGRDRWVLVGAAGLAVFMASLDMSIVNIALPAIQQDLGTRASVTEWVVLGYLLPLIALALPSGRWLDGVGRRPALVFSVAGFAVASVACGLAPGIEALIAARVLQGAFGAVLLALIPALATTAVRPQARGRAMGVVTTVGPLGLVSGPALGGLLVQGLGWPWIFYVNVPVSLAVIAIGWRQLPAGGRLRLPDRAWYVEATFLGTAVVALMLGLSLAADGDLGWLALALLAIPLVLLWRRLSTSAAVRDLLATPGVPAPHVALAAASTAIGLVFFVIPFHLVEIRHVEQATAGLTVLAFPLAMAVTGPLGGVLADWWGARRTALVGAALFTVALGLLVPLGDDWTPLDLAWRLAAAGIGNGLFNAPNMTMAMSSAPKPLLATAGASTSLARQSGFALGPALATTVWALSDYRAGGLRLAVGIGSVVSVVAIVVLAAASRDAARVAAPTAPDGGPPTGAADAGPPDDAPADAGPPGAGAPTGPPPTPRSRAAGGSRTGRSGGSGGATTP
ncbi:MFS transporter [Plantactinospora alkalitolerans]